MRTKFQQIIDAADLGDDRHAVSMYANFILNTSPGYRPSDAAREAVRQFRANPERIRSRESGCAPTER